MATEQKALVNLSVAVLEVYQKFLSCKGSLDTESYRRAESQIRKLKERFQFCTPFGRGGAEVAAVEQEVRSNLASLSQKIDEISAAAKTSLPDVMKEVEGLTAKALQAMERREKLLVR